MKVTTWWQFYATTPNQQFLAPLCLLFRNGLGKNLQNIFKSLFCAIDHCIKFSDGSNRKLSKYCEISLSTDVNDQDNTPTL